MQSTNFTRSVAARSAAVQQQLAQFIDANPDIKLALVTSSDGFEVASSPPAPMATRIAAMSSSLQALSEAIAREAALGSSNSLIIEADGGTILVLGIAATSPRLSLAVVAKKGETLGTLLWAARNCCKSLEGSLK